MVERRGLKAERKAHGPNGKFVLKRKTLRQWIGENTGYVDLRRVDQPMFMDLIFGREL